MWILVFLFVNMAIKGLHGATMDTTPLRIQVTAGGNAALPCTVRDRGTNTVYWMGPKDKYLFLGENQVDRDSRITLTRPYQPDWNLHIKGVKRSDEGVYKCKVNTDPLQTKLITLEVNVPPRIVESSSTLSASVEEGGNVTLTCTATGVPTPKFMWHVKHKDSDRKQQLIGSESSYTLYEVSRKQAGTYICTAVNGIGSPDTHEMKLSVHFSPEITASSKNVREYQGRSTKLVCQITLHPVEDKNLYWVKGGHKISSQHFDWKYKAEILTIDETSLQLWLDINYLDTDDFGNYTCVANNDYGQAMDVIVLEEHIRTTKAPPTTTTEPTTTVLTTTTTTAEESTTTTTLATTEGTTIGRETTLQLTSQTTSRTTITTAASSTTSKTPVGPVIPPDPISPSYNVSSSGPKDQTDPENSAFSVHQNFSVFLMYTVVTLIQMKIQRFWLT